MMAVTSSVGPGATNMVTAAALAHVNRLPLLLLPGDVFANRVPDPVLQQVENPSATARFPPMTASGRCRAISTASRGPNRSSLRCNERCTVLTDPAECGPVTLALCQDVQAEAYDYPESFFEERLLGTETPAARCRRARRRNRRAAFGRKAAGDRRRRCHLFRSLPRTRRFRRGG